VFRLSREKHFLATTKNDELAWVYSNNLARDLWELGF
jgi:hypothetical protein